MCLVVNPLVPYMLHVQQSHCKRTLKHSSYCRCNRSPRIAVAVGYNVTPCPAIKPTEANQKEK